MFVPYYKIVDNKVYYRLIFTDQMAQTFMIPCGWR